MEGSKGKFKFLVHHLLRGLRVQERTMSMSVYAPVGHGYWLSIQIGQ